LFELLELLEFLEFEGEISKMLYLLDSLLSSGILNCDMSFLLFS